MEKGNINNGKMQHSVTLADRVEQVVTPYSHMSYDEQLKMKQDLAKKAVKELIEDMTQLNPKLKKFVAYQKTHGKGLVCPVDDIVPSPVIDYYRNKCEFTIGKSEGKVVVGFAVGSEKQNKIEVGPVMHLRHINQQMKTAVMYFEEYLQNSLHEPFNPSSGEGIWRQMTIRTTNKGDFIIIICIHPQSLSREELDRIRNDLLEFLIAKKDSEHFKPTAIYFQERGQLMKGEKIVLHQVYGDKNFIEETILGKDFRASPDSFLQVNTAACEKLYEKIGELAKIDSNTAVLDICCGVGTIGVAIAKDAGLLSGVDFIEGSIEHARFNADVNGIPATNFNIRNKKNAPMCNKRFYHGKAEDYISIMLSESKKYETLAILDPPRAGIGTRVIQCLRMNEFLNKLIYVSCDTEKAVGNFRALIRSRSKSTKGECFIPVRAIPVDMFPHTKHLELIILFEKYDEIKWNKIISDTKSDGMSSPLSNKMEENIENNAILENLQSKKRRTEESYTEDKRNCSKINIKNEAVL